MKPKHLLMDLDGTIVDARNLPLAFTFVRKFLFTLKMTFGWRKAVKTLYRVNRIFKKPPDGRMNSDRAAGEMSRSLKLLPDEAALVFRGLIHKIFPTLEPYFFPVPGAREFVEWAKDHFSLTLATNPVWTEDIVRLRLSWSGVSPDAFRAFTHVERMKACKPHVEYYLELLAQEGLSADECLHIGNDYVNDLAATRAGIRVFILSKEESAVSIPPAPGGKAKAWKGSYHALRKLLESGKWE